MPTGISNCNQALEQISINIKKAPPKHRLPSTSLRLSAPKSIRTICGTNNPNMPMMPTAATELAVIILEHKIKIILSRIGLPPTAFTASSPKEMAFNRQLKDK